MSAVKTKLWDSARYLKTTEDIELYLNACMEEMENTSNDDNHNAFMLSVLASVTRAKTMNLSEHDSEQQQRYQALYQQLVDSENLGFVVVFEVINALGFRLLCQPSSTKHGK